jgi:hypothetical protein
MFMVGDVKQSIYGFRLAEPGLFLEKYNRYRAAGEGLEGGLEKKIVLAKNFRSRKSIVDGVNFIFRQIMGPHLGGIIYDRDNELVFGASFGQEVKGAEKEEPLKCEGKLEQGEPLECLEVHLINRDGEREDTGSAEDSREAEDGKPGMDVKNPKLPSDSVPQHTQWVVKKKDGGWQFEAAINKADINNYSIKPGNKIGFTLQLDDSDGGDRTTTRLWRGRKDTSRNRLAFGRLVFSPAK